jgi:hypothetical protein
LENLAIPNLQNIAHWENEFNPQHNCLNNSNNESKKNKRNYVGEDHVVATNNKTKYVKESFEKLLVCKKRREKKGLWVMENVRFSSYLADVVAKLLFSFPFLGKVRNLKPKPHR